MILSTSSMIAFGLGGSLSYLAVRWSAARAQALALKEEAKRAAQQAHAQTEALNKRAERRAKRAAEQAQKARRRDEARAQALTEDEARIAQLDKRLGERQERQDERHEGLQERHLECKARAQETKQQKRALKELERASMTKLEERAEVTQEHISAELQSAWLAQAEIDAQRASQRHLLQVEASVQQRAGELLKLSNQRYEDPRPPERLMGYVPLPRAQKKRQALLEPSNGLLSALHEVTGVEFALEGQLEEQAHDPKTASQDRREPRLTLRNAPESFTKEVARFTFERWVQGGQLTEQALRTHHRKSLSLLERQCREAGVAAAQRLDLKGIHPEILNLVGKLLFRTSYTQNQWHHAIEAASLSGMIAEELKIDATLAKRATLLHDIGKVLWEETEAVGSHAVSGAAFARAHGELEEVIHPIAAHHHDEAPSSALAYLVIAADTLSGARPGARRETSEAFSQHIEQLEGLCSTVPHLRHQMIIQGGREVRLQVDERRYSERDVAELSSQLAFEIEDTCVFPGQIKVTALRELITSATAHARRRGDAQQQHQMIQKLGARLSGGAWRGGEVRG